MPKKSKAKIEKESKKIAKKLTQAEYEKEVLELASKDLTSEKIGEMLRKRDIHPREYNKKVSEIIGEKYLNPDLKNIKKKLERIQKHSEKNKQDKRAKREKDRVFSQLKKIKEYLEKSSQ